MRPSQLSSRSPILRLSQLVAPSPPQARVTFEYRFSVKVNRCHAEREHDFSKVRGTFSRETLGPLPNRRSAWVPSFSLILLSDVLSATESQGRTTFELRRGLESLRGRHQREGFDSSGRLATEGSPLGLETYKHRRGTTRRRVFEYRL